MTALRIALAQMQVVLGQPDENMRQAQTYIERASMHGAGLVLLPELWISGYDLDHAAGYAKITIEFLPELQKQAARHSIWIAGSYITEQSGSLYNTFLLISPDGEPRAGYDKTHLFRLLNEQNIFSAGQTPVMAETPWGNLGLAICYDMRFPELLRSYGRAGAPLSLVVAEWGAARRDHWRTLMRARAIENQMFIAAVNTCGRIGDVEYAGHSAVVDPWGDVLAEAGDEPALIVAEIDFDRIQTAKDRLSSWEDDRPDLYAEWR